MLVEARDVDMDRQRVAQKLVFLAKELVAGRYSVKKDFITKKGVEFEAGDGLEVDEYINKGIGHAVRLVTRDGRAVVLPVSLAHKIVSGFPKPPSVGTMTRWVENGVARSVDGQRVEPDGYSRNGAPSWLLAMGMI